MNHLFKKIIIVAVLFLAPQMLVYSASIHIDTIERASSNRQPVIVYVSLDAENDTISGIAGNFSYDADLFDLQDISLSSSVVSLWVKQPNIGEEKYFDGRTHVTFEGIFPGGYSGVRSPYYQGTRQGSIFTVTLIPKNKGNATLLIDDIILNEYTSEAKPLPTENVLRSIVIPDLVGALTTATRVPREVHDDALVAFVTRDELISRGAWYLVVNEEEGKSAIASIHVAETDDLGAQLVDESSWRKATSQYILLYQNRIKYIHVRVTYVNGTYAYTTLPPVENSQSISLASRILLGIALALFVVYLYVQFFIPRQKQ